MYNYSTPALPVRAPQQQPTQVPAQQPVFVQVIPPDLIDGLQQSKLKIARLEQQLKSRIQTEEAYREIVENGGCLYAFGKRGQPVLLMNRSFGHVFRITPLQPLFDAPFYVIELSGSKVPLILPEADFQKDAALIHALRSQPGVEVFLCQSQKQTADLLRQAVIRKKIDADSRAYAGWRKVDGTFTFKIFPGPTTHQYRCNFFFDQEHPESSASNAATSAAQFWPAFAAIHDDFSRWMVIIWFYLSQLHSLLLQLGYSTGMALYLFSAENGVLAFLSSLFRWYGDPLLSFDMAAADFARGLIDRCDQPLLVRIDGHLKSVQQNKEVLEEALVRGVVEITQKAGKKKQISSLRAPLTLVSDRPSVLCCDPKVLVLDLPPRCFEEANWVELYDCIAASADHRNAFVTYTEEHISELKTALGSGHKQALHYSDVLNEACVQILGVFLGMSEFLAGFFHYCCPTISPIEVLDDRLIKMFINLLENQSQKLEADSVTEQFIYIVRKYIRQGLLKACPRRHTHRPNASEIVFWDGDYLYFTADALYLVGATLYQSRPLIVKVLADAGILCGGNINQTTSKSVVTVWQEGTDADRVSVYKFRRAPFEELGDPLLPEEEGKQ